MIIKIYLDDKNNTEYDVTEYENFMDLLLSCEKGEYLHISTTNIKGITNEKIKNHIIPKNKIRLITEVEE